MIIWIASYPKSGNTWLRLLLSDYLYGDYNKKFDIQIIKKISQFPEGKHFVNIIEKNQIELSKFKDINFTAKYWLKAQDELISKNKKKFLFLKTHAAFGNLNNYNFTDRSRTAAVFYVVRHPFDVLPSISNHYNESLDESFKYFFSSEMLYMRIDSEEIKYVGGMVGSWQQNFQSWLSVKDYLNVKIIKYENLQKDTYKTFLECLNFIKQFYDIEINEEKIKKTIERTNFSNLQKIDAEGKFSEAKKTKDGKKIKFFNVGKSGYGKKMLTEKMVEEIEKKLATELKLLKYL